MTSLRRRPLLKAAAASLAIGAAGLPLRTEGAGGALSGEWVYDPALGVLVNEELSARLRRRAALRSGRRWRLAPPGRSIGTEYGRAYAWLDKPSGVTSEWFVEKAISDLAWLQRHDLRWATLPHLRRTLPRPPWESGPRCIVAWYGITA